MLLRRLCSGVIPCSTPSSKPPTIQVLELEPFFARCLLDAGTRTALRSFMDKLEAASICSPGDDDVDQDSEQLVLSV